MKYSLTGKTSEQCGLSEAMASGRASYDQVERQNLLNHSSRTVAVDETAGLVQVETPEGRWWVPKGSEWTLSYHLAEQDRQVYGELRPGQIILDCGANIGTFAKRAAAQASVVAAIEPSPENLECLRRNLRPEIQSGRVILVEKGVWDSETVLTLHVNEGNSAANTFIEARSTGGKTIQLPLTTIDKLVTELKLPRVDYIKMDIEGSERRALAGAKETLRRFKPAMSLCVYHGNDDPVEVPKIVKSIQPAYSLRKDCLCTASGVVPQVFHFF